MTSTALTISAEPFDSDDARRLVAALDEAMDKLYSPEQRFGPNLRADHLSEGRGTFLLARTSGLAVGCGAVRLLGALEAEIKRMWVEPGHRGQGIGRQMLVALEEAGRKLGAQRLVLETGIYQLAAMELYRNAGFTQCDCWGEYATSPTSVCFEKNL